MGRHTPGAPTYIVQNMPGAASLKSVAYLEQGAPSDGTVIATFNPGLLSQSLTIPEKVNVDFRRFAWIGNISEDFRVCFTWHAKNLKTFDQVKNSKQIIFGTTGVGTSAYIEGRMLDEMFGVNLKQVQGYPGSADKRIAIERGELDGDCGSWTSLPDDWMRDNKINLFVRFSKNLTPDMPKDLLYAGSLLTDPETKATYDLLMSGAEVGRPYMGPSALPADRLAALRTAFNATMKDAEFLSDAKKQRLEVNPQTGEEVAETIAQIYKTPPAAIKRARVISGE
jgi:tripartite-type tricarboxylate transporter receptor subunit TctC